MAEGLHVRPLSQSQISKRFRLPLWDAHYDEYCLIVVQFLSLVAPKVIKSKALNV